MQIHPSKIMQIYANAFWQTQVNFIKVQMHANAFWQSQIKWVLMDYTFHAFWRILTHSYKKT